MAPIFIVFWSSFASTCLTIRIIREYQKRYYAEHPEKLEERRAKAREYERRKRERIKAEKARARAQAQTAL